MLHKLQIRQLKIWCHEHVCNLFRKGALDSPELEQTWFSTYTLLNLSSNSQMSPKSAFSLTSPDVTELLNTSELKNEEESLPEEGNGTHCSALAQKTPRTDQPASPSDRKKKRRKSKGYKDCKSSRWKALSWSTPPQSGTGKPGVLQSMGSQRVRHDWATELNWCSIHLPWWCWPSYKKKISLICV